LSNPASTYEQLDGFRSQVQAALAEVDLDRVTGAIQAIRNAYDNKRTVFVMGNGGSAATGAHLVCDLKYAEGKTNRVRVTNLSDNTPLLTALANDDGYPGVFVKQLEQLLEPGDVVIVISVSGDSENVVRAVQFARERGAATIGFLGAGGGRVGTITDHPVVLSSKDFPVVESVHCVLTQMVAATFRNGITKSAAK
jgi:D-sedoheptulose 7-phosphate isomerase